jgi:hypothetical protein
VALSFKFLQDHLFTPPLGSLTYELAKEFDRLSLGFLNSLRGVTVELEPTLEREIKEA